MNIINGIESGLAEAMKPRAGRWFYPLLIVLLVLIGFAPLAVIPGIPQGHDLYYHLARLNSLAEGLKSGAWFVPISANLLDGYGYASGLFYPDIFLYPAAWLIAGGLSLVTAYKIFLVGWGLFIAFGAYHAGKRIGGTDFAGFACALLYSWSSYLAVVVLIRAALGEYLAFAFYPWVLLGCYDILYGQCRRFHELGFGMAGLVLSHNLSVMIVAVALLFWFGLNGVRLLREPRRILAAAGAAVLALALSAFFWVPMLEQLLTERFIISSAAVGGTSIADRAVPFLRLFLEVPYMRLEYWIPSGIGLILMIAAAQRLRFRAPDDAKIGFQDNLLLTGLFALLCATNFLPWEGALKAFSVIQFPWRSYLLATAALALGGGLTLQSWCDNRLRREQRWLWILLAGCASAWWINVGYIYAAKIYEGRMFHQLVAGAKQEASGLWYLPQGALPEQFALRGDVVKADGTLLYLNFRRPRFGVLEVEYRGAQSPVNLELPLVYYKGYAVRADGQGKQAVLHKSAAGLVEIAIPKDMPQGHFTVWYAGTRLTRSARWLSLAGWSLLLALVWFMRKSTPPAPTDASAPPRNHASHRRSRRSGGNRDRRQTANV